ncbi:P-loop containing nucleoside triphosphate hydrolase protein [Aureobasidium subglaciale]|nr:P-loop containing nucleoside triphosphate hydrolase protein [Aureobasidium subglaciale]
MDLFSVGRQLITTLSSGNGTDVSDLPIKLLEAVVPGYSLFANTAQQWLGFDISLFMTCIAFFFIAKRALEFIWYRVYRAFLDHLTSSVHIDGSDDLYLTILEWISATRPDLSKRSLTARTQYGCQYDSDDSDDEDGNEDADMLAKVAIGEHGYFNFSRTAAKVPPRYEPDHGQFWFSTTRGTFLFTKRQYTTRGSNGIERTESAIDFCCIGLSTNPIKLLLGDIKAWTIRKESSNTAIRIPCEDRWNGWMRSSERPPRPLDTVILDPEQKTQILQDMNEYLHPVSSKWYASRGIPYRRGYLFSGPPGTGKTSLSFSLAGIFGLDIYIINLMDPSLSESTLSKLFNNLPKRCIVLFEDIDAAGIQKRNDDTIFESSSESESELEDGYVESLSPLHNKTVRSMRKRGEEVKDELINGPGDSASLVSNTPITVDSLARALIAASRRASSTSPPPTRHEHRRSREPEAPSTTVTTEEPASKISLSGLLNVVDGVATHEGRILIMTTNHPEKLDPALIRPGRVDMQISFTYASTLQTKSLFMRMYTQSTGSANGRHSPGVAGGSKSRNGLKDAESTLTNTELETLGTKFAQELPEGKFAPSDVQGYLLMYRKKPREAVEKAGAWRDSKLAELSGKGKSKTDGRRVRKT